jgi:hypothetical protein
MAKDTRRGNLKQANLRLAGEGGSHLNLGLRSSHLERDFQWFSSFRAGEIRDLNVTLYHEHYCQCLSQFTINVTHNYYSKVTFTQVKDFLLK